MFYVDWNILKCVQDCDGPPPCGGQHQGWEGQLYTTWESCCVRNLSFLPPHLCHLVADAEETDPPSSSSSWNPSSDSSSSPSADDKMSLPSSTPSTRKSLHPSRHPTIDSSHTPSTSTEPSIEPTQSESANPSSMPTQHHSFNPSSVPSDLMSVAPSREYSYKSSSEPSNLPSSSLTPSNQPSDRPTVDPTISPTFFPTNTPTLELENQAVVTMDTFFHLVLILDPADIVYDYNLAEAIEDITLKYLKANIGGENRYFRWSLSQVLSRNFFG